MELELRLATLSKLLDNPSATVQSRLGEELRRVEDILEHGTDYDKLEEALKTLTVLAPKFHGAVLPALVNFVRSVPARTLTRDNEPIGPELHRHHSASHLIREAIDVSKTVRYIHLEEILVFLLELSRFVDANVQEKAQTTLESLAQFNLHYFNKLGAGPQTAIVMKLTNLENSQLVENAVSILRVLHAVLSSSMEGHTWTHDTMTITRGAIQSRAGVAEMRTIAIDLLKRMYPLKESVVHRKAVLSALNAATHLDRPPIDLDSARMFERDTLAVLNYLRGLVATEALPLVQAIEHNTYWNYVRAASPDVEAAALAVRDALILRNDYEFYKQLIGFEGIFGNWETLRNHEEEWDYSNTKRQEVARSYVESINVNNQSEWRDRILEFAKTESDDLATFSVFYEFLELLGRKKADLALDLVANHEEDMQPFLIPLIRGLQAGELQADIEAIVQSWLFSGTHLIIIAKSLFKGGAEQLDTLSALVARASQLDEREALSIAMGVAAQLHAQGCAPAKSVFMKALRMLAQHADARWAHVFWFGQDFKALIAEMDAAEQTEVLSSLAALPELNYQTEELLRVIGEQNVDAVLGCLADRLKAEAQDRAQRRAESDVLGDKFEAIPYHLHGLPKLLRQHPDALISLLHQSFGRKEDRLMFPYRGGGRLVKAVFPNFEPILQTLLLQLIETGDEQNIEFALAIIQSYGGSAPILDVCKAIIKVVPEHSSTWKELAAAIETTGGVWGEDGMVRSYKNKRDELATWKSEENERVRAFAEWLSEQLERMITFEQQRADEELALRKYQYGGGVGSNES